MDKELVKNSLFWIGLTVLSGLYIFFVYTIKYNSVLFDETRIVAEFFDSYFATDSFVGKMRALFYKENETYPGLIRSLYLFSYYITGSVQFKWLGYIADALPVIFLAFIYVKRHVFNIDRLAFLTLAFLLLNPYPDHIYYFTYASFFYFISILVPVVVFYYFTHQKYVVALVLLFLLGLSSSTYLIVGGILVVIALLKGKFKPAILTVLVILPVAVLPTLLHGSGESSNRMEVIVKSFSHLPELIDLFFTTLGSWVQLFNSSALNKLALWIGVVGFLVVIYQTYVVFKREGFTKLLLFFTVLQVYFWLVFISTTVLRWNLNYDLQYNQIFSVYKSFFVFMYLFMTLLFFYSYIKKTVVRTSITAVSLIFVLSYLYNYYYNYNVWVDIYKESMMAEVNYTTRNKEIKFSNFTFYNDYRRMREKRWLAPDGTPFDTIDLQKNISQNKFKTDTTVVLKTLDEASNGPNIYDISLKPLILYSMELNYYVNPLRHQDGLYLYFDAPEDKVVAQFRPVPVNPVSAFLKVKNYNSPWMILTFENSIALELHRTTYDLYLINISQGKMKDFIKIGNRIKVSGKDTFELLPANRE